MPKNLDGSDKKQKGSGAGGGRPVALNLEWIAQAIQVIQEDRVVTAWTDEDIVNEVNFRLDYSERSKYTISKRTYDRYKAYVLNASPSDIEDLPTDVIITLERFWQLLDKKVRDDKLRLMQQLEITKQWQKWAWIFERKFTRSWALTSKLNQIEAEAKSTNVEDFEDKEVTEVEVVIVQGNQEPV